MRHSAHCVSAQSEVTRVRVRRASRHTARAGATRPGSARATSGDANQNNISEINTYPPNVVTCERKILRIKYEYVNESLVQRTKRQTRERSGFIEPLRRNDSSLALQKSLLGPSHYCKKSLDDCQALKYTCTILV